MSAPASEPSPARAANLLDDLGKHAGRNPALLRGLLDRVAGLTVGLCQRAYGGLRHGWIDAQPFRDGGAGLLLEDLNNSVENSHDCDSWKKGRAKHAPLGGTAQS